MSGIVFAISAGVSFGVFQAVNRRLNQMADVFRVTFALLVVAAAALGVVTASSSAATEVSRAPLRSLLFFAGAGVVHFFFGWTFLGLSQQRIGAGKTGVVIAATPLIGAILASLVLGESLPIVTGIGVLLVVGGVMTLSSGNSDSLGWRRVPWFGLAAAVAWGTSPLLIRWGLEGLQSPLVGVTVGMAAAAACYAVALLTNRNAQRMPIPARAFGWLLLAGLIVSMAIAFQWTAYDLIPVAPAISLMQLSTPVVILVAPLIAGVEMERLTVRLLVGMGSVMTGSILVVLSK